VIAPGDADALVGALRKLSAAPALVADMGRRARQMLDARFTRRQGFKRWHDLLDRLVQPQPNRLQTPLDL
jgi:glycosyltransferase involved in cell wall biosynthesis